LPLVWGALLILIETVKPASATKGSKARKKVQQGIDAALTIATKRCTITLKIQERQNEQIGKVLGSSR
jgi:hypothetical protein